MTLQNEPFEEMLSQHLARELEPQRGRAAAAFKAQLAAEAAEAAQIAGGSRDRQSWARRQVSGKGLLFWTLAPSAVAAALALAITLRFIPGNPVVPANQADGGGQIAQKELPRDQGMGPVLVDSTHIPGVKEEQGDTPSILPPFYSNPAIRTADYVEPAGHAYPLGTPQNHGDDNQPH